MKKSNLVTNFFAITTIICGVGWMNVPVEATTQNNNSIGSVEFTPGVLTLDAVPNFDFGSQEITTKDETYQSKTDSIVTVTDLRGSSIGWNLTVKQDTQLKTAQNEELKGAQLTLSKGTLQTSSDDTATVSNGVLIPGGGSIKVLEATVNQGNGTFSANWSAEGAILEVPGTSVKLAKQYTANLIWTLTDAPE
ncbi:WxL domain-containing protein [Enterococcus faecalis]|uniref:WxL domain-containing protein n=1 Tax=Enterococcus faecalis TaxID=1351 RepID=UPI001386A216|nr:WxL domain-containing protein [Enterococcus faecalis]MEB7428319.1 WxL domain-containing protein [Enterococcus faecalis]